MHSTFQQRGSTHRNLSNHYYWRSRYRGGELPDEGDLDAAFKHHSLALSYGGMGIRSITIQQLQQMVDILEANPTPGAGSIGICEILINITPENITYRYQRADRMAVLGLKELLRVEAVATKDASFEDIARAVAACSALEDHDRARALIAQGRKMAKASGDEVWQTAFASYRRKRQHKPL